MTKNRWFRLFPHRLHDIDPHGAFEPGAGHVVVMESLHLRGAGLGEGGLGGEDVQLRAGATLV